MNERVTRISDWMRFYAPEVKRRIDLGETLFVTVRDTYQALRKAPTDPAAEAAAWQAIEAVTPILNEMPPGSLDYLGHIGKYIP